MLSLSIQHLQAVPGYQIQLSNSFAADVSFPLSVFAVSPSVLPLPAFAFGGVWGVCESLTVSGASSIWDQHKSMVFWQELPASRYQQHQHKGYNPLVGFPFLRGNCLQKPEWFCLFENINENQLWVMFQCDSYSSGEKTSVQKAKEKRIQFQTRSLEASDWYVIIWLIIKSSGSREMEFCLCEWCIFCHPSKRSNGKQWLCWRALAPKQQL